MKTTYTKLTQGEWLVAGRAPDEGLHQFAKRSPAMIFALALADIENLPTQIRKVLESFQRGSGWLATAATGALQGSKMACITALRAHTYGKKEGAQ